MFYIRLNKKEWESLHEGPVFYCVIGVFLTVLYMQC